MTDRHTHHKALIAAYRAAQYDFPDGGVPAAMRTVFASDAVIKLAHPFGTLHGPDAFYDAAYAPLLASFPDLERRDHIVMAGTTPEGADWVGCGGYYTGTFTQQFLDIPATRHQASMRFHEFYRFENGKVTEFQGLWDIPELMMQAGAWPMAPTLGREWHVPGPATCDGIVPGPHEEAQSQQTCQHIIDMLEAMKRHPSQGGPEVMEMPKYWHNRMSWYGPSGIGTARGIDGFRKWHQIPFLAGMPDRGQYLDEIEYHFFGDGNYAAVTGWPDMAQSITHDGWLGIAPVNKKITMRSLDFWRVEHGKIRENWVMVDLLDMYAQIGVDVFRRLRDFNKARAGFDPDTGKAL